MGIRVIGIWAAFEHEVSFEREGISKYILYLSKALLEITDIEIEFWCYDFNRQGLTKMLAEAMAAPENRGRIHIRTPEIVASNLAESQEADNATEVEQATRPRNKIQRYYRHFFKYLFERAVGSRSRIQWLAVKTLFTLNRVGFFVLAHLRGKKKLLVFVLAAAVLLNIVFGFWIMVASIMPMLLLVSLGRKLAHFLYMNKFGDPTLAHLAKEFSRAEVFLIPYIGIGNSVHLRFPKVMALHDLSAFQYIRKFLESGFPFEVISEQNMITYAVANRLAKQGCYFVSNSEYVMKTHGLGNIPSLRPSAADFVYLPVNVAGATNVEPETLFKRHGITRKFIFFPSQIRPYKNTLNLLKAFERVVEGGQDLELVLTASNWKGDPNVAAHIEQSSIQNHLILTGNVSEEDLFALHKHAELTVVPTLFEGGLPWPALEAWHMGTPVAMSAIPQVLERMRFVGVEPLESGVALFDPLDVTDMAEKILSVLKDPKAAFSSQQDLASRLGQYTWKDAARKYESIFDNLAARAH